MENEIENLKKDIENEFAKMSPIGELFDTIQYSSYEELDKFVTNLNQDQSLYCLLEAVKSAYKRGAFKIEETEVISKSIRILSV